MKLYGKIGGAPTSVVTNRNSATDGVPTIAHIALDSATEYFNILAGATPNNRRIKGNPLPFFGGRYYFVSVSYTLVTSKSIILLPLINHKYNKDCENLPTTLGVLTSE